MININPHLTAAPRRPTMLKPLPKELVEALRSEFRRLVEDPHFIDNLLVLGQLAANGHALASTLGGMPRPRSDRWGSATNINGGQPIYNGSDSEMESYGLHPQNHEQFGARMLREIVALAPSVAVAHAKAQAQSPAALVEAIALAKDKGLTAMVEALEKKLLDSLESSDLPPVASVATAVSSARPAAPAPLAPSAAAPSDLSADLWPAEPASPSDSGSDDKFAWEGSLANGAP